MMQGSAEFKHERTELPASEEFNREFAVIFSHYYPTQEEAENSHKADLEQFGGLELVKTDEDMEEPNISNREPIVGEVQAQHDADELSLLYNKYMDYFVSKEYTWQNNKELIASACKRIKETFPNIAFKQNLENLL